MALINNIAEFNTYVSVASNLLNDKFLKYTKKAERDLVNLMGKEKFEEIEESNTDDPARELLCEYSANMGLSYALPAFVLNITNFGVFTNQVDEGQRAEWHQVKDLNRSLLKFAFNSLDDAIQLVGVEFFAKFDGLFIRSLDQFEHFYPLSGSSQTFISLIPFMREAQEQYLRSALGSCFDADFDDRMLSDIRGAVANYAVAKAALSGSFKVESSGFLLRFEVLPWEKVEKVEQSMLEKFNIDRMSVATGYLNRAMKSLKDLPCFEVKPSSSGIERRKSGLYL